MDGLTGKALGPYKILEKIGEGGMGVVYKGFQESLGRYVAIKVLRGELAQDAQFIARFRREALAVAKLSHPNILHIFDTGVAHGTYYIVMDYVDGGSLSDLLGRGPLATEAAVSIAAQVADALDYAHRQSLIHRDVKPANVLLTSEGHPLLTDFGIARALDASTRLTRAGTHIGTPEYMAPEQAQGQPTDRRTDIYALGIVLYEMLTGQVPFSTPTPMATLYKQVNETAPPLRQMNIAVPAWLQTVVDKALAKRPQDRYQRASEFAVALRRRPAPSKAPPLPPPQVRQQPSPHRTAPAPVERQRKRNPVPVLIGAIGILLLILVASGLYLVLSDTGEKQDVADSSIVVTRVVTPEHVAPEPITPEQVVTLVVTTEAVTGVGTHSTVETPVSALTLTTTRTDAPSPVPGTPASGVAVATPEPPTPMPAPPTPTLVATSRPAATNTQPPKSAPTKTPQPRVVVLFVSTELSHDDLFTIDEKGGNRKRLTTIGRIGGASYSPDGRRIAFSRIETEEPVHNRDIYVMNADGSHPRNITQTGEWVEFDPDWSPDGKRIVFRGRPSAETYSKVYIMNADGSGRRLLTDVNNSNRSPAWAPHGMRIAFVSYWEGGGGHWNDKGDLFTINADGSGLANLTERGEAFSSPVWSPNGQELVYGRLTGDPSRGEYWQIWRMNAAGGNQHCIIGCQGEFGQFSNVPSAWQGSRILFSGWKDGNWDVFVANDNGGNIARVTRHVADEKTRDWSP